MKSTTNIDYKLPLNFRPEWAHLFRPDYKYKNVDLKVKELKNVFVNHYGLVIKNGFLVKGCAPNIGFSTYDKGQYYKHWRKATEQMLVCNYGKSLTAIKLDDNKKYLLIHSPWFSYYFWLSECLPRLLMVKEQLKDLVLIYPENWKACAFVNETLGLFPELEKIIIPADTHLFVSNLIMPEVKPWTPMFIPEQIIQVRDLLIPIAKAKLGQVTEKKNVYLSREDAKYKNIANKAEFEKLIGEHDFEIHTMSGKSIFEQIYLMQGANKLISINGAGMANFMFLNKDSSVLELSYSVFIKSKRYKFHFKKILDILGANYLVQLSETQADPNIPEIGLRNIIVDLKLLENNLTIMDSLLINYSK